MTVTVAQVHLIIDYVWITAVFKTFGELFALMEEIEQQKWVLIYD